MINNIHNEKYDKVSRDIAINLLDILNTKLIAEKCGVPIGEINMFENAYKKGLKENQLKIAKNLMDILNDEMIAQKCDLSLEEVRQLRKEYKENE